MKSKSILIAVLVMASLLAVPAFAACTGVCDTSNQYACSKSATTLTKGTSSTLTVTITNQQSSAVTSLAAALQCSWFSASSSSTTIASIQANGGQGTADFSITPTSTGGQDVCVALGSLCTADCGAITVSSAAELGVTSITAPASVDTSSTFTVSATIRNAGTETAGSTTGVTATLTSSQCTVASETKTIGTITGSGTSSVSWSVSAPSSAATCSFSLSSSGTPGGTATGTKSVTISATSSSSSSSSSSSGGSGGAGGAVSTATVVTGTKVVTTAGKSTITVPEIKAGASALVKIDNPEETNVRQIAIAVKNAVKNIGVVISKVEKPATPALTDKTFSYLQIETVNVTDSDIISVTIDFQVDKTWIDANKIDKSKVVLNRFANNVWTALTTKQMEESDKQASYRAESPGLSIFAVSGKELPVAAPTKTPAATPQKPAATVEMPQIVKDYGVWIVAFLVIAAVLGYLYYHGHHHINKATKFAYDFKK